MNRKFALKRLTASDLTLFEWHFRNHNAGNQKAINLNADIFVSQLYPSIEVAAESMENKLPLDLWVVGPGNHSPINLQRKIIKGVAYKNWRLDGEYIANPPDDPNRFNSLRPTDFVLFGFEGNPAPWSAIALFIAQDDTIDTSLFELLSNLIGDRKMIALDENVIARLCQQGNLPADHVLHGLIVDEDLIEASTGNAAAAKRTLAKRRFVRLSPADLRKARDAANKSGELGEALVEVYLQNKRETGAIANFDWISAINAVAPFDFMIDTSGDVVKIDVKTTTGIFDREFHVSNNELMEMAHGGEPYQIYRVYQATNDGAMLRISEEMAPLASKILSILDSLPPGTMADGVSIAPKLLQFGEAIALAPFVDDD